MRVIAPILMLVLAARVFADPIDLGPGRQPQMVMDARGRVFVTYGRENAIYFTQADANGGSFSEPLKVASAKHLDLGMRRGPRIAVTNDAIVITAIVGERGNGQDGDMIAWRSTDDGKTWSEPVKVSDAPAAAREGLGALASDGNQNVLAAWLDLRDGKSQLYGALSRDGGKTFEKNQLIYQSPDGHICECCHPSIAFDASGNIHLMFRNWIGGNRDMWHSVSQDQGKTFEKATQLDEHSWKLGACPMDGGAIVADGESFAAAYRRDRTICLFVGGRENLIGEGTQPVLARGENGMYCAWLDKMGRLLLRRPFSDDAREVAGKAIDPVLAGNGKGAPAIAWERDNHVFVDRIRD